MKSNPSALKLVTYLMLEIWLAGRGLVLVRHVMYSLTRAFSFTAALVPYLAPKGWRMNEAEPDTRPASKLIEPWSLAVAEIDAVPRVFICLRNFVLKPSCTNPDQHDAVSSLTILQQHWFQIGCVGFGSVVVALAASVWRFGHIVGCTCSPLPCSTQPL